MGRPKTGNVITIDGKLYARMSYVDPETGKRKTKKRVVESHSEGRALLRKLIHDVEDDNHQQADTGSRNFQQLADWYEKLYAVDPVYKENHKVAGLRGRRTVVYRLKLLKDYFGTRTLRTLTYGQVEAYKMFRLGQSNPKGQPIKIATVHRELALLRRLLNLAVREGWMNRNVFNDGDSLIVKAHEQRRRRVLSLAEENRLLSICEGERGHLKPIVICALDTGMRTGEIFSLTWRSIHLASRTITIEWKTTKTLTTRQSPVSSRLARILTLLHSLRNSDDGRVFGIERSISKAWKTLCRKAELADLRPHDLRHTFNSRLIQAGVNPFTVALLMGHAAPQVHPELAMTFRYTHTTEKTFAEVVTVLDEIERQRLQLPGAPHVHKSSTHILSHAGDS